MSQPYPPPHPGQPSPYPQPGWSDPRAAVPGPAPAGPWAPGASPYGASPYGGPQYGGSQYGGSPYGGPQPPQGPRPDNSMGVAALVLAIVGLALSWIPFVGLLSVLLGALAIVFGLVGWNRARLGRAGLVLPVTGAAIGIVAIVAAVLSTTVVARLLVPPYDAAQDAQPVVAADDAVPGVAPAAPAVEQPAVDDGTVAAPGAYTWADGLSVRVSDPVPAEFSDTACCPGGSEPGVAFEVTVVNGTSETIDAYGLFATLTADGRTAEQVFDVERGFDGVTSSIPPGRELVVTMAFDAPGGDLLLELTTFGGDEAAFFTATL